MIRKPIAILAIILALSKVGIAQVNFNYGPELGVSFAQSITKDSRITWSDKLSDNKWSFPSPIVGIHGQATIVDHLLITVNTQYRMTGTRYHKHEEGKAKEYYNNSPEDYYTYTYTRDEWVRKTFHRLSFPITVGYTFSVGKFQPSLYLGFTPNFFLSGRHYEKTEYDAPEQSEDYIYKQNFDPVHDADISVNTWNHQVSLGIATKIGKHVRVALKYNYGMWLDYVENDYPMSCYGGSMYKHKGLDVSVTYLLQSALEENR